MGALLGHTAVVTGATGAVGSAIAARLVSAGAKAILVGRRRDILERLVADARWRQDSVCCHAADLTVESDVLRLAAEIGRLHSALHVLVHSAGLIAPARVADARLEDFDRQHAVNVRAPYQLTQALLPELRRASGQIVFINSSAGITARGGTSQYAATKHALRALADSLRDEVNTDGIRVMSVYLGRTASRMQSLVHEQEGRPYRPEALLQPDDVAAMVVAALELPRTAEVTDVHIRPMRKF